MNFTDLDLLLRLIVAHAVSDFFLQSDKWIEERRLKKIRSKHLYFHTLITGALTYLALGNWYPLWIPLVITLTHYVIDLVKSYIKKENNALFIADQALHLLIIFGCWLIYTGQFSTMYESLILQYSNSKLWLVLLSYIVVSVPASIIITRLTAKWNKVVSTDNKDESLKDAGKWIGIIERILVLTFTLVDKYEAIGFLLAAKSVFRFGDLKEPKDRKRTEYILIGTLISFSLSIIMGLIVSKIYKLL